jgi:hypothetical protein
LVAEWRRWRKWTGSAVDPVQKHARQVRLPSRGPRRRQAETSRSQITQALQTIRGLQGSLGVAPRVILLASRLLDSWWQLWFHFPPAPTLCCCPLKLSALTGCSMTHCPHCNYPNVPWDQNAASPLC